MGSNVVFYVASGGQLAVVALDGATGKTVWTDAATQSGNAPGEAPYLAVVGSKVVYLRSAGGHDAQLTAADGATGRRVWASATGVFTTWPGLCPQSSDVLCASGVLQAGASAGTELRFSASDGSSLPGAVISASSPGRTIALGLYDAGQRDPERLVAINGPAVAWNRPLASIFPAKGASTDWGWNIDRVDHDGLFVGGVGYKPKVFTPTLAVDDMSAAATAGFRTASGARVWLDPGSQYVCDYLPCPGADQHGFDAPAGGQDSEPTIGLRLRSVGTVSGNPQAGGAPTVSADARTTLEGFNLATGKTLWSFDAGHATGLMSQNLLPAQVDTNTIVLDDAHGRPLQLVLATGRTSPVPPSTVAWCRKDLQYKQNAGYDIGNGGTTHDYTGQASMFPCSASGARVAAPASVPSFVGGIGAAIAGRVIWADATAVVAAPQAS